MGGFGQKKRRDSPNLERADEPAGASPADKAQKKIREFIGIIWRDLWIRLKWIHQHCHPFWDLSRSKDLRKKFKNILIE